MAKANLRSMIGKLPLAIPVYHATLRTRAFLKNSREYQNDYAAFRQNLAATSPRFSLLKENDYPVLGDKTANTAFDPHYIYHVSWAARVLARTRPAKHVDIASSLNFASVVSAFIPMEFYDYRPANLFLSGLDSKAGDLMRLPFPDGSVASLSCMHVVEHIGLGRYSDPIDADGDLKAIAELKRIISPGGQLIFVTPIGQPRICFNAHRIYSYRMIVEHFVGFDLEEFVLISDDALTTGPTPNATEAECDRQKYGCGCFAFRRPIAEPR